uniref:At1g48890 n=1 Tax=Arabidopsis thaliana TaxID=3702 RepID=Q6NLQ2_ARATH|nr:At1g48890 [Arabidopsis thaliana]
MVPRSPMIGVRSQSLSKSCRSSTVFNFHLPEYLICRSTGLFNLI